MNCECDMLRVVRGNGFKLKIKIEAYTPSGNKVENFELGEAVLKIGKKEPYATKTYTILEGTTILVNFNGSEELGTYGMQMSGRFEGEAWRWANNEVFKIVETNASANIPEDFILIEDTYLVTTKMTLFSEGGGGSVWSVNGQTEDVVLDAEDVGAASAAQGAKADTALQPSDVDSAMSDTSENPVQNKVVKEAIDSKLSEVTINAIPAGSVAIINDLTTGGATNSLSAEMGKIIKQNVQTILNALGEYAFPNGKPEISWEDTPTPPTPTAYDAEVEYLESTGTQYIDTLQNLQTACSTYIKMSITKAISSNAMVFGAFMDGANSITPKAQLYINSSQKWTYSRTENIAVSGITLDTAVSLNTIYELTVTTQAQTNDLKAYLFARNNNGNDFMPIDGMRLYGCTMTKDNVLVRDFIPVRVGQVGYLYDRVSGELFANAGSGNFILGNDKNA